ncbi:TetR family transcriptional regulator, partial [Mycolicibacter kumamotonensis]
TPNPGLAFTTRLRQLKSLLSAGTRSGDIRVDTPSMEMLSRCVMDLLWMPENIVRGQGTRAALILARDTLIRGAAERSSTG